MWAGLAALLARAQSGAAEPELRADRHRHQGPRRRASASRRGSSSALADGALPEARTRVDRFVFGPPVGFPVQFRVIGPDPMKVRAIAEDVRRVMATDSQDRRSASRLERAGASRSGSRSTRTAPARSASRRRTSRRRCRRCSRLHRHAVPRGHRAHRRGGARDRRTSGSTLGRLPALDHRHPQRRGGAAVADRAPRSTNTRSRSCGGATATRC